jgi:hypothetical protein
MKNLVQVMGKGCGNREVEHCPVMYHFELSTNELTQAILDPSIISRELGVEIAGVHVSSDRQKVADHDREKTVYCCTSCLTDSICCTPWPAGSIPVIEEA